MASVKVFSAERMSQIEATTIVNGEVDDNNKLVLIQRDGTRITIDKNLRGERGLEGPPGEVTLEQLNAVEQQLSSTQQTASSALSTAQSAIDVAQSIPAISYGSTPFVNTPTVKARADWLRFPNGVQISWVRYRNTGIHLNFTAAPDGSWITNNELRFGYGPTFWIPPSNQEDNINFPSVSVSECIFQAYGGGFGTPQFISKLPNGAQQYALVVRSSHPVFAGNYPLVLAYMVIGYWKDPR